MNVFADVRAEVLSAIHETFAPPAGIDLTGLSVAPPQQAAHGEIATNAALLLAKPLRSQPRAIAERLAARIGAHPDVAEARVAGPGFINLVMTASFWSRVLETCLDDPEGWGRSAAYGGCVNVEYVSANPTGPLTIAHARGTVVGDALANLLETTGHTVTREYYVNDAGAQIRTFAESVRLRLRELEGVQIGPIPAGYYPASYVADIAAEARQNGVDSERPWEEIAEIAVRLMLSRIRDDLAALGVHHHRFTSERALHSAGRLDAALTELRDADLAYRGTLPPPKDADPATWVAEEQLLFRSTAYGDDCDRTLVKADGGATYFAGDVAYHRDKLARGYDRLIGVMGVDHAGYVTRLQAVVDALSAGRVALEMPLVGLVNLLRGGEPVKMSKRAGEFVSLREVIEEVGADAVRFIMLTRKAETPLDFDLAEVKRQAKDNPVFYVQYAHARCCSLQRRAVEQGLAPEAHGACVTPHDVDLLSTEDDRALLLKIAHYPEVAVQAAQAREPHRIATYAIELAGLFHQHWTRATKDVPDQRILQPDAPDQTRARLALATGVRVTLARALAIMGVTPLEAMTSEDA